MAGGIGSIATQAEASQVRVLRDVLSGTGSALKTARCEMGQAVYTLDSLYGRLSDMQVEAGNLGRQLSTLLRDARDCVREMEMQGKQLDGHVSFIDSAIKKFDASNAFSRLISRGLSSSQTKVAAETQKLANSAALQFSQVGQLQEKLKPEVERLAAIVDSVSLEIQQLTETANRREKHYQEFLLPSFKNRLEHSCSESHSETIRSEQLEALEEINQVKRAVIELKERLNRS